jgi:hypothetical protein
MGVDGSKSFRRVGQGSYGEQRTSSRLSLSKHLTFHEKTKHDWVRRKGLMVAKAETNVMKAPGYIGNKALITAKPAKHSWTARPAKPAKLQKPTQPCCASKATLA